MLVYNCLKGSAFSFWKLNDSFHFYFLAPGYFTKLILPILMD